jgi:hypothetical protein
MRARIAGPTYGKVYRRVAYADQGNRSAPTVLVDARGKIQGLLPGEDLSELRTALLERPHDLEVLVEEARRATSIQRDAPDQTHLRQQVPGHVSDRLRAAEIDDGVVEREVDARSRLGPAQ